MNSTKVMVLDHSGPGPRAFIVYGAALQNSGLFSRPGWSGPLVPVAWAAAA